MGVQDGDGYLHGLRNEPDAASVNQGYITPFAPHEALELRA
jgi:hypothetical protein